MTDRRVYIKPVRPAKDGIRTELVGDDQLTGGTGTWEAIARPRRRAAVEWTGTTGYTYVLPLLISGVGLGGTVNPPRRGIPGAGQHVTLPRDRVVETDVRSLISWATKPTKTTGQPCVVKVTGPLMAPDSVRWVITDLAWGTPIRNKDGHRVQQYVTVTLTEWIEAEVKRSPAKHSRHHHGKD